MFKKESSKYSKKIIFEKKKKHKEYIKLKN